MASKRELVIDALKAVLVGITGIADAKVYRSRVAEVMREEGTVLVITQLRDEFEQIISSFVERHLEVALSIYVRGPIPDETIDDSISSVYAKVMADTTLGGKVMDIEPGDIVFQMEDADQPALIVTMLFRLYYRHQMASLDA